MPQTIIELLNNAEKATRQDECRRGNVLHLPPSGKVVFTGDLHGHRRNFERIVAFADLGNNPDTHVILHEAIHGGPEDGRGGCLSYKLLFDVARYKLEFPNRVHTIMGNHDTAFISNGEVMKNGKEMNRALHAAMKREYAEQTAQIESAMKQYLFSQPLAVKCPNRIWMSHSLPADRFVDKFDPAVLDRPLTAQDIVRPGSAYIITWGRRHSRKLLDKMADLFDVDIFILGHQPQDRGCCRPDDNLFILASDHNHGCILPVDLTESYTPEKLSEAIVPLTSIA